MSVRFAAMKRYEKRSATTAHEKYNLMVLRITRRSRTMEACMR